MADELQLTVPAKIHMEMGIQSIKPKQFEIVAGIVKGDAFAVLPTGYGMLSTGYNLLYKIVFVVHKL